MKKIRLFLLLLFVMTSLSACGNKTKMDEVRMRKSEQIIEKSVYADALDSYKIFLHSGYQVDLDDATLHYRTLDDYKYTIIDMNDDGVPELVLDCFATTYYYHDEQKWGVTTKQGGIFTYSNGTLKLWYSTAPGFEILDNRAIYYTKEDGSAVEIYYMELDKLGNIIYTLSAIEVKYTAETPVAIYYINRAEVPYDEYLRQLEPIWAYRSEVIPWKDMKGILSILQEEAAPKEDTGEDK